MMDPNATLRVIREIASDLLDGPGGFDGAELAELTEAMDRWLVRGGYLPDDWNNA